MRKSQLIQSLAQRNPEWTAADIRAAIVVILDGLTDTLRSGGRVEVRGFGSFVLRPHASRNSRNPKTGEKIVTPAKLKVHFKAGNEMRDRVNSNDLTV